jgi:uncharacterized protein (DUF1800 family)
MRSRVQRVGPAVVALALGALALGALELPALAQLPPTATNSTPLTERERAVHLLSRATYGVRPADLDEVMRVGRTGWLDAQLHPDSMEIGPKAPFDGVHAGSVVRVSSRVSSEIIHSKISRAAFSRRQLEELMTDFWFNHFNVFIGKGNLSSVIADYEEYAIRQHVFGRFEDMLVATARHSAMLFYLDNYLSTIPNTDSLRGRGLNENYARELLELHTLGVDGGYTQRDVIEVARAFTGWGVQMATWTSATGQQRWRVVPRQPAMLFELDRHDQGSKVVLSLDLPAGRGMEDGLDILKMLARHPATAHHLATKLVTHFVSDEPPPRLVAEISDVFLATDGDLRAVTRALFTSELFYDRAHYRAKTKRPLEFLISALRVTATELPTWVSFDTPPALSQTLPGLLQRMGHLPYWEPLPTGYPSAAEEWVSAGALLQRLTFAAELTGSQLEAGLTFDPFQALSLSPSRTAALLSPGLDGVAREGLPAIADPVIAQLMPGVEAPGLSEAIARDLSQRARTDPGGLLARAVALTLGSPQFQQY